MFDMYITVPRKKNLILTSQYFLKKVYFLRLGIDIMKIQHSTTDLDYMTSEKELAKPHSQIPNMAFKKGNNKFKGLSL